MFWNWCTIFILGFGNLAALDFQARCMAAKDPFTARWGCIIGGIVTFVIGMPYASLGSILRYVKALVNRITLLSYAVISLTSSSFDVESITDLTRFTRSSSLTLATPYWDFPLVACGNPILMRSSR